MESEGNHPIQTSEPDIHSEVSRVEKIEVAQASIDQKKSMTAVDRNDHYPMGDDDLEPKV